MSTATSLGPTTGPARTDPTGRLFLSYKRSRVAEVESLIHHLHNHGIPTWQDRRNLVSEPTIEAIRGALDDRTTAGAIVWLTKDVADSRVILEEEAPRIMARARSGDGFTTKLCLADELGYEDADRVLVMPSSLERPSKSWNLRRVKGNPAERDSLLQVARAALFRRLAQIHAASAPSEPLRLLVHAHARATPAFQVGPALAVDWVRHFEHRHVPPNAWATDLLPALDSVAEATRSSAPGRRIVAEGFMTISTALALGRVFMEPGGISCSWRQLPKGEIWSLLHENSDCGFSALLAQHDSSAYDLAVLVSIRGVVEPAVRATPDLPNFRAILRIQARDNPGATDISSPLQASSLARLVADEIRNAKRHNPLVRKTHIFYAGPAGVAMMIGQQLNAIGPVQTYEHFQSPDDGVGKYIPAALLCDHSPCT